MPRRFIQQLSEQETVDEIFLAANKQLRPNRNGDLYLQVDLCDRTGTISARLWNADEALYNSFENGDFVRVRGTTQIFQGAMQMIASRIGRDRTAEIDEADFFPLTPGQIDRLTARLMELLRGMRDAHLRALAEAFLMDGELMARFCRAPAGIKNHHAYPGGLLEHVVTMMEAGRRICECYEALDRDLLLMGIFLHDIGKIDELTYERGLGYSDEGQLVGHLVLGVTLLDAHVPQAESLAGEPFPARTLMELRHLIVSHHGDYQFGSPKLPMTLEALALTYLDNLDAKLNTFQQLLREDATVDPSWTQYHAALGRKLYKRAAQA
jgi:3'-5' exoribonuclease